MVKMYPVEADTKVTSTQQPYAVEHTTLTSKVSSIHEQSIFPKSFSFVFNATIDLLYLTNWGKLFQSRHALNNTEFMS